MTTISGCARQCKNWERTNSSVQSAVSNSDTTSSYCQKKTKGKHFFLYKMRVLTAFDKVRTTTIFQRTRFPLQDNLIRSRTDDVTRLWISTSPGPRWLRCPERCWEWRGCCCDASSGPAVCPEASCPAAPCLWRDWNSNEKVVHLVYVHSLKSQWESGSTGSGSQTEKPTRNWFVWFTWPTWNGNKKVVCPGSTGKPENSNKKVVHLVQVTRLKSQRETGSCDSRGLPEILKKRFICLK